MQKTAITVLIGSTELDQFREQCQIASKTMTARLKEIIWTAELGIHSCKPPIIDQRSCFQTRLGASDMARARALAKSHKLPLSGYLALMMRRHCGG